MNMKDLNQMSENSHRGRQERDGFEIHSNYENILVAGDKVLTFWKSGGMPGNALTFVRKNPRSLIRQARQCLQCGTCCSVLLMTAFSRSDPWRYLGITYVPPFRWRVICQANTEKNNRHNSLELRLSLSSFAHIALYTSLYVTCRAFKN